MRNLLSFSILDQPAFPTPDSYSHTCPHASSRTSAEQAQQVLRSLQKGNTRNLVVLARHPSSTDPGSAAGAALAMGSLGLIRTKSMAVDDERAAQAKYWQEHSAVASVEAMLLDSQAAVIDQQERPEVRITSHL